MKFEGASILSLKPSKNCNIWIWHFPLFVLVKDKNVYAYSWAASPHPGMATPWSDNSLMDSRMTFAALCKVKLTAPSYPYLGHWWWIYSTLFWSISQKETSKIDWWIWLTKTHKKSKGLYSDHESAQASIFQHWWQVWLPMKLHIWASKRLPFITCQPKWKKLKGQILWPNIHVSFRIEKTTSFFEAKLSKTNRPKVPYRLMGTDCWIKAPAGWLG